MVVNDSILAIETRQLTKRFGGVTAVNKVDFQLRPGERHGIIGPNGAGKTTFFNLITGTHRCTGGNVALFGEDVTNKSVRHRALRGVSRTYQVSNLFLDLSVAENLALAANSSKVPNLLRPWKEDSSLKSKIDEIAEQVHLEDKLNVTVKELSHGEKRQLELGLAVAIKPKILMFDEPAAGLSPTERVHLVELINQLVQDTTLLIIEHDMEIIFNVAEKITVLNQGQVIAAGSPEEIKANEDVQKVYIGEWV